MIERDVFHIRLKDIELQAERLIDSSLKERPVAIISSPHPNGSIISLSREAKEEGLSRGMRVSMVKKMSNSTQLLPYNHSLYNRIHHYVYLTISLFTPVIESKGIGEFFLDMKGMHAIRGDIQNNGLSIIDRIKARTSLTGRIGISVNKLVSRIITSVISEPIYKVDNGKEKQFLSPLHPMVLPVAKETFIDRLLNFLLIKNVGQIQLMAADLDLFRTFFGAYAIVLHRESKGYDTSLVKPIEFRDHIIKQTILPEDTNDRNILYAIVKDLAGHIAFELRKRGELADRVYLEIHYTDGYKGHKTGAIITLDDISVSRVCKQLFDSANYRRNRVRSILIDVCGFHPYVTQENLFSTTQAKRMSLSQAVENIRSKYGLQSLQTVDVFQALNRK